MAYMSQEKKATLAPEIKRILAKFGLKGSLSVDHYSTLVLTIKSGKIDFIGSHNKMVDQMGASMPRYKATTYLQVNTYHCQNHFDGLAMQALVELRNAMNVGNHDNSDIQFDHHDVGWYVNIHVGSWKKPYVVTP